MKIYFGHVKFEVTVTVIRVWRSGERTDLSMEILEFFK